MSEDYLLGKQLDEYRLESLLGQGGMARVYRGLDVNLNRPVAIKVIDLPHRADSEYEQRFLREAQAIARLDHPHIVRLYRYGKAIPTPVDGPVLYMAMQFIQGADLKTALEAYRRDGAFVEADEVARVIREICLALDYAHAAGVIHRDVKSSNIMLDGQGRAILTDFGLAMLSTQVTRGEIFGSPHYIAPEQALSSARAKPQSDLYAVGVILYEMITGQLPFTGDEPLQIALKHVNEAVPAPRRIRPSVSPELEAVLFKALEKRPEDRYQTGQELSAALDAALLRAGPPTLPAYGSITERVTVVDPPASPAVSGQALQPRPNSGTAFLPVLPTLVPGQAEFGSSARPTTPAARPARPRSNRQALWIGLGAGLLLLLLCATVSGVLLFNRLQGAVPAQPAPGMLARTTEPAKPSATPGRPTERQSTRVPPTRTPAPAAGPFGYDIEIMRQGEDKGYLLIINSGEDGFPLAQLELVTDKVHVGGADWEVEQLEPGECLLATKKKSSLPERPSCKPVGKLMTIPESKDGVFKEELDVLLDGERIGVCEREERACRFSSGD